MAVFQSPSAPKPYPAAMSRCTASPGSCLSAPQKTALANIFRGARNSAGTAIYAGFPLDPGINSANWASWKFQSSIGAARDPVAVGFIFQVPPAPTSTGMCG